MSVDQSVFTDIDARILPGRTGGVRRQIDACVAQIAIRDRDIGGTAINPNIYRLIASRITRAARGPAVYVDIPNGQILNGHVVSAIYHHSRAAITAWSCGTSTRSTGLPGRTRRKILNYAYIPSIDSDVFMRIDRDGSCTARARTSWPRTPPASAVHLGAGIEGHSHYAAAAAVTLHGEDVAALGAAGKGPAKKNGRSRSNLIGRVPPIRGIIEKGWRLHAGGAASTGTSVLRNKNVCCRAETRAHRDPAHKTNNNQ
jgi:hypothetical protein